MMKSLECNWVGIAALIMHNGQTSDPLNKHSKLLKEVSSKRKKSDADYERMAQIEFAAGLYIDKKMGIVIPSDNILATVIAGAKLSKLGRPFASSFIMKEEAVPLEYDGPKDPEALYEDKRFVFTKGVKVQQAKVQRTRPIFKEWSISFTAEYDEEVLNKAQVVEAMHDAGQKCGLCDWRPRYGRFNSEVK